MIAGMNVTTEMASEVKGLREQLVFVSMFWSQE